MFTYQCERSHFIVNLNKMWLWRGLNTATSLCMLGVAWIQDTMKWWCSILLQDWTSFLSYLCKWIYLFLIDLRDCLHNEPLPLLFHPFSMEFIWEYVSVFYDLIFNLRDKIQKVYYFSVYGGVNLAYYFAELAWHIPHLGKILNIRTLD